MFPGFLSRLETASGLLVRGISINGHFLLVESCSVFPQQDMEIVHYIQGGPRGSIADIGMRKVEGQVVCPIRVDSSGVLEPAVQAILNHAQQPSGNIRLDTNHALSYLGVAADGGSTDDNRLISFDGLVVTKLAITASPDAPIKLTADFLGQIDMREEIALVAPPATGLLGRELGWNDCSAGRLESSMRGASSLEVTIENKVDTPTFLLPYNAEYSERHEFMNFVAIKGTKFSGSVEEVVRLGADRETYLHGGWMVDERLRIDFGPIQVMFQHPLFKVGEQPITSTMLKRTTRFMAQNTPNWGARDNLPFISFA